MSIRVVCQNGHALNVKDSLAGKTGLCPFCNARVVIPRASNGNVSEDEILGFLGPHKPKPKPHFTPSEEMSREQVQSQKASSAEGTSPPNKTCDKCNREISAGTHICPHCHTYIGGAAYS